MFNLIRHDVPFTISTLFYAAGYATGLAAFYWAARRRRLATDGVLMIVAAGLVGGLLFANISQLVFARAEGKSILGAIAGGYLCVVIVKRLLGIVRPTGDLFAFAISAGEAVGRWGCYFAGCCYGRVAHGGWAIFQHGAFRYPTQIYMSIASAAIFCILLAVDRLRPRENLLFCVQMTLLCASRFVIEFYRATTVVAFGLSWAQFACVAGFLAFGAWLVVLCAPTRRATKIAQHGPALS